MTGVPVRQKLAVLGSPIEHSKSPQLHHAAYEALGLDWEYTRIEVRSGELSDFLLGLDSSWIGLSLTMPLKEEALSLADSVDVPSLLTGATNTITFSHQNEKLAVQGFNTDVAGIVGALAEVGVTQASEVLILGAGATARSAIIAAAQLGAAHVTLAARSPHRAEQAVAIAESSGLAISVVHLSDALVAAPQAQSQAQPQAQAPVTISTLPGAALTEADLANFTPGPHGVLLDVAYDPWPSHLATLWQSSGGTTISGLWMLARQALVQIRIFVAGDPELPLPGEDAVFARMLAAVGLAPTG